MAILGTIFGTIGAAILGSTAVGTAEVAVGAGVVSAGLGIVSGAATGITTGISTAQQNAQIEYQQQVAEQEKIAAQNKAAAEARQRRAAALKTQATTRAQMAATGIDSTSGSFLDLVGQGAAAGELDVLKAKHDGNMESWALNNKINELESQKRNAWLEGSLAGATSTISNVASSGLFNALGQASQTGNVTKYNSQGEVIGRSKTLSATGKNILPAAATSAETGNYLS